MKSLWRAVPLLLLILIGHVWAQDALPTPTPITPLQIATGDYGEAGLYQDFVPQGRAGLLRVTGANLQTVEAVVFDQRLAFFSQGEDTYYAVFAVPITQKARVYDLPVTL